MAKRTVHPLYEVDGFVGADVTRSFTGDETGATPGQPISPSGGSGVLPYADAIWDALGTSVTAYAKYTVPLATLLDVATLHNRGRAAGTLASGFGAPGGSITSDLASVADDADLITLEVGINDFRLDVPLGTIADTSAATSFYGALRNAVTVLAASHPDADIAFITPYGNTDTNYPGKWNTPNTNGDSLADFRQAIHVVASMYGVNVVPAGERAQVGGPYAADTLEDDIHPNDAGGAKLAAYIGGYLNGTVSGGVLVGGGGGGVDPDPDPESSYSHVKTWSSDATWIYTLSPDTDFPVVTVGSHVVIVGGTGWTPGSYTVAAVLNLDFGDGARQGIQLNSAPAGQGVTGGLANLTA